MPPTQALATTLHPAPAAGWEIIEEAREATDDADDTTCAPVLVDSSPVSAQVSREGTWIEVSKKARVEGGSFLYSISARGVQTSIRFAPEIPRAGRYKVYIGFRHSTTRARDVQIDVKTGSTAVSTVIVDQRQPPNITDPKAIYLLLGTFEFDQSNVVNANDQYVVINGTLAEPGRKVVVDALLLVPLCGQASAKGAAAGIAAALDQGGPTDAPNQSEDTPFDYTTLGVAAIGVLLLAAVVVGSVIVTRSNRGFTSTERIFGLSPTGSSSTGASPDLDLGLDLVWEAEPSATAGQVGAAVEDGNWPILFKDPLHELYSSLASRPPEPPRQQPADSPAHRFTDV